MKLRLLLLALYFCLTQHLFADTKKVTYTIASTSTVTSSGTVPEGSKAIFKNTYSGNMNQLTAGNTMTLTLSGFDNLYITGLTLSMKSNQSSGTGYLSVTSGSTTLATIGSSTKGVSFNNKLWNGSWASSYVNITPTLTKTIVGTGKSLVITIGATENSLYCQSFTITYEDTEDAATPDISISPASCKLYQFQKQQLAVSTNSDGKLSYSSANTSVATVDEQGLVTAVGPGTTTITATITATANYVKASATHEITVMASSETYRYQKITSTPDDWTGEYIIAYEEGTTATMLNGSLTDLDVSHNVITTEISENTISTSGTYSFAITSDAVSQSKYYIQSFSGNYIGHYGTSNALNQTTTKNEKYRNTLAYNKGYCVLTGESGYQLQFYPVGVWFRYYNDTEQKICLYKRLYATTPDVSFGIRSICLEIGRSSTQKVTTNSDGEVIYVSSNPEVATVDATTGKVTALAIGKVTITATIAATQTYEGGSASYEVNVITTEDMKNFINQYPCVEVGKTFRNSIPTGDATYTSADETIATVDETGLVTGVSAGWTTITGSFSEGTSQYTLTVYDEEHPLFESQGKALVCEVAGHYYAMRNTASNNIVNGFQTIEVEIMTDENGNPVAVSPSANEITWLVSANDNGYLLQSATQSDRYLSYTDESDELMLATNDTDANTAWTFSQQIGSFVAGNRTPLIAYTNGGTDFRFKNYLITQARTTEYEIDDESEETYYSDISFLCRVVYAWQRYPGESIPITAVCMNAAPDMKGSDGDLNHIGILYVADADKSMVPESFANAENVVVNEETRSINLTDKVNYYAPEAFTGSHIQYQRTNTAGWNSVCLPFDFSAEDVGLLFGEGSAVYKFTKFDAEHSELTFVQVRATESSDAGLDNKVAAGTPCLVKCTDENAGWNIDLERECLFTGEPMDDRSISNVSLQGAFTRTTLEGNGWYKLTSDGTQFGIAKSGSAVIPFRIALQISEQNEVSAYHLKWSDEKETTDAIIPWLNPQGKETFVYDLSGRRTYRSEKSGIYVTKQKKVIVK